MTRASPAVTPNKVRRSLASDSASAARRLCGPAQPPKLQHTACRRALPPPEGLGDDTVSKPRSLLGQKGLAENGLAKIGFGQNWATDASLRLLQRRPRHATHCKFLTHTPP